MATKRKTKKDQTIVFLEDQLAKNTLAIKSGPKKKTWAIHDLKKIAPLTHAQRIMMESYIMGNNVIASGSAGTGKTYVAAWLALHTLLSDPNNYKKIIFIRSPTATKSQGFLPGTLEEKQAPFELPFKDIFQDLLKFKNSYDDMKEAGLIEFHSTSFIRGLSWKDAIIVIDECQSATLHELNSVITRVSGNSKLIICGDVAQNDLLTSRNELSGMVDLLRIAERVEEFDVVTFTTSDIVRSKFVKSWLIAKEELGL